LLQKQCRLSTVINSSNAGEVAGSQQGEKTKVYIAEIIDQPQAGDERERPGAGSRRELRRLLTEHDAAGSLAMLYADPPNAAN
jgi:hypothetical protein